MLWQYRPLPARLVLHKGCFCSLLNSAYCRDLVPRLGAWVTRFPEVYEYLVDSILNFPGHKEIKHLLEETSFTNMCCHRLTMESYASILTPIAYLNRQQNKPGHVANATELPHRKKEKNQ